MSRPKQVNSVRQQGFREADAPACALRYPAPMFQPRVVGALLVVGGGLHTLAWRVEAFLVLAVETLVFLCLGAFLFHHLRGEGVFARRTAPWASGE